MGRKAAVGTEALFTTTSENDNAQPEHAPDIRPVASVAVEVLREMIVTKERELEDLKRRLWHEEARFSLGAN